MKIYVISLKDSVGRRADATSQLDKLNFDWQLIDAVDGRKLSSIPSEYNPSKVRRLLGFELTSSELGCFLSHKKIWHLIAKDKDAAVILEDDFVLSENFESSVLNVIRRTENLHFLRLQGLTNVKNKTIETFEDVGLCELFEDPLGSSAYYISPTCASHFIKRTKEIFEPLDHFLANTRWHDVESLALLPYPVEVSEDPSTIIDRGERKPIRGCKKIKRSLFRFVDRIMSKDPWF
jgi:glycosyl transferase family 25